MNLLTLQCNRSRRIELRLPDVPPIPVWKTAFDFVFLLATLPVWLPLMCLIGIGIKIVSPGPIFFRQKRVGYGGRTFTCLKFRSMRLDADTEVHAKHVTSLIERDVPMTKMDKVGDPRLIPFGLVLRASGLDELPQFINILAREMSLVGPRPCTLAEFAQYTDWHKQRFNTLPGLTGLWQVSGKNRTTFKEMVRLDIFYANSKTLWMDLKIVMKTLPSIVLQIWEN